MNKFSDKANAYKEGRKNQRDTAVVERVEKLKTDIPEAIKKCKTKNDLETCGTDISEILNFLVEVMGLKPKDVRLLVT